MKTAKNIRITEEVKNTLNTLNNELGISDTQIINDLVSEKNNIIIFINQLQKLIKENRVVQLSLQPEMIGATYIPVSPNETESLSILQYTSYQFTQSYLGIAVHKQIKMDFIKILSNEVSESKTIIAPIVTLNGFSEIYDYFNKYIDINKVVIENINTSK